MGQKPFFTFPRVVDRPPDFADQTDSEMEAKVPFPSLDTKSLGFARGRAMTHLSISSSKSVRSSMDSGPSSASPTRRMSCISVYTMPLPSPANSTTSTISSTPRISSDDTDCLIIHDKLPSATWFVFARNSTIAPHLRALMAAPFDPSTATVVARSLGLQNTGPVSAKSVLDLPVVWSCFTDNFCQAMEATLPSMGHIVASEIRAHDVDAEPNAEQWFVVFIILARRAVARVVAAYGAKTFISTKELKRELAGTHGTSVHGTSGGIKGIVKRLRRKRTHRSWLRDHEAEPEHDTQRMLQGEVPVTPPEWNATHENDRAGDENMSQYDGPGVIEEEYRAKDGEVGGEAGSEKMNDDVGQAAEYRSVQEIICDAEDAKWWSEYLERTQAAIAENDQDTPGQAPEPAPTESTPNRPELSRTFTTETETDAQTHQEEETAQDEDDDYDGETEGAALATAPPELPPKSPRRALQSKEVDENENENEDEDENKTEMAGIEKQVEKQLERGIRSYDESERNIVDRALEMVGMVTLVVLMAYFAIWWRAGTLVA